MNRSTQGVGVKPRENAVARKRCCDLPVRGARVKELLRASIAFVNNGLRKVCVGDAPLLLSCESLGGRRSFLSLPLLLLLRHSDHHFLPTSWTVPGLRSFSCFLLPGPSSPPPRSSLVICLCAIAANPATSSVLISFAPVL